MRRFLFLDKLWDASDKVRIEYEAEIQVRISTNFKFIIYKLIKIIPNSKLEILRTSNFKKKKPRNFTKLLRDRDEKLTNLGTNF